MCNTQLTLMSTALLFAQLAHVMATWSCLLCLTHLGPGVATWWYMAPCLTLTAPTMAIWWYTAPDVFT